MNVIGEIRTRRAYVNIVTTIVSAKPGSTDSPNQLELSPRSYLVITESNPRSCIVYSAPMSSCPGTVPLTTRGQRPLFRCDEYPSTSPASGVAASTNAPLSSSQDFIVYDDADDDADYYDSVQEYDDSLDYADYWRNDDRCADRT